ncbi:transposase [Rhodobacteraceae bacterium MYP1-1]|uniref:Transposase n=1 Tax=Halocynthiibacter styelae TaxID=2761955 RepID=A0A8J7LJ56_9RHOB|nr:transposase [Paenihalocynthiibacter styelae]
MPSLLSSGHPVTGNIRRNDLKLNKDETIRYKASKFDCDICPLKQRCCPREPQRKVTRSIYEPSRDVARALSQTQQYAISCRLRKKVEMSFAHLKRIHGLERLRLRGPSRDHGFAITLPATHVAHMMNLFSPQPPRTSKS